jgi:prepilin-type N-terminal cleavage/methylation domain-containing protein
VHVLRKSADSKHSIDPSAQRRGFTLIELLVALLLLDVGLLALVGFAAALYRDGGDTRASARAGAIASARIERMASLSCGGPSAGTAALARDISEWFTEAAAPNDTRLLADSVRVVTSRGVQVANLRTLARC